MIFLFFTAPAFNVYSVLRTVLMCFMCFMCFVLCVLCFVCAHKNTYAAHTESGAGRGGRGAIIGYGGTDGPDRSLVGKKGRIDRTHLYSPSDK